MPVVPLYIYFLCICLFLVVYNLMPRAMYYITYHSYLPFQSYSDLVNAGLDNW